MTYTNISVGTIQSKVGNIQLSENSAVSSTVRLGAQATHISLTPQVLLGCKLSCCVYNLFSVHKEPT